MPGKNGKDNSKEQNPGSVRSQKNDGENPPEEPKATGGPEKTVSGEALKNDQLGQADSAVQSDTIHLSKTNERGKEIQGNERNGKEPKGAAVRPPHSKYTGIYEEKSSSKFKQTDFCDTRFDDNLVYDDQEEFTIDGLSAHDFRGCSNSGSETCVRKTGIMTPITRTSSDLIRDIEKDYEQGHLKNLQTKDQPELKSETKTESKQTSHHVEVSAKHEPRAPPVVESCVGQGLMNDDHAIIQRQAKPVDASLKLPATEVDLIPTQVLALTYDSDTGSLEEEEEEEDFEYSLQETGSFAELPKDYDKNEN